MTTRFRRVTERVAVLVEGPAGWGEFAPFPEYPAEHAARWLAAALEAAWQGWPQPVRGEVAVNAIVPALAPEDAARAVRDAGGCRTAKVKVADPGGSLADDVARVGAVRAALDEQGPGGRVRVDANGAWTVHEAARAVRELDVAAGGLEYVEQPVATLAAQAELRRSVDVPLAVDEGVRLADDPARVAGVKEAADVLVLKVAPLGGTFPALALAETYRLPVVVSSALDTSVGLAAGVALAGALGDLPYACGLGSGRLLAADVVTDDRRLLPEDGRVPVRPYAPVPDPDRLAALAAPPAVAEQWRSRLAAAYGIMTGR
jgi:O-succinylbenzoate synthase